jgi:hypothetical protein
VVIIKDENTKYMEFITTGGFQQHYISIREKLKGRKEYLQTGIQLCIYVKT